MSNTFDVKQRDWCLVYQAQKPEGDAPPALLFVTSIDKNTSYDDLLEHWHNGSAQLQVLYAPAGTVLGDYMRGLLATPYEATDWNAMLENMMAKIAELAQLPRAPGVGYGFCAHHVSLRNMKLDFYSHPEKVAEYTESLAKAVGMIEDVEKNIQPPLAPNHVKSLEEVVQNIKGCNGLIGTGGWDPTLREVLSHCEDLTGEGLLPEDLYLRMADWMKQQRDMKNRGRLMYFPDGPRPGLYVRHPKTRAYVHSDDCTSEFPATDDLHDPWCLNQIHHPVNLLDR